MTAFAILAPAHGAPRATRAGASDRPTTAARARGPIAPSRPRSDSSSALM